MKLDHPQYQFNPLLGKTYGDKTFKISGSPIEVIQAMAYVKALGGGHVYIGLGLIPAKNIYYKGQFCTPEWEGRLNKEDFDVICTMVQNQKWVKSVNEWTGQLVDYDFDKIDYTTDMDNRFNMHPMDRFGKVSKIHWTQWQQVRMNSWLDIPAIPGRPAGKGVIFAGQGWEPRQVYAQWRAQAIEQHSLFVGSEQEHQEFEAVTGIKMGLVKITHPGELAQWVSGMNQIIATPNSWAIPIAQACGKPYLVQSSPDVEQWRNPFVMGERGNTSVF